VKPTVTLRDALADKKLLGNSLVGPTFFVWRVLLMAALGEALTDAERVVFKKFTGRDHEPGVRVSELAIVGGRRSGKSRALATLAAYIGGLCDYRDCLVPGEVGVLLCLAQSQHIAKQLLNYCEADFDASPILSQLVIGRTADTIELKGNIKIEVRPASMKKLRGPTYIGILLDELAFFFTEAEYAHPDSEIIAAVTPGLLTTRGMTVMASSPYARRGILWDTYKKHYGPDGAASVLVAQGTTRDFNPTVSQAEIDRLLEKDPARNRAEYLAEFRTDLETFVVAEIVAACVTQPGLRVRPPQPNQSYYGACDPSGGSADSFVAGICHQEYGKQVCTIDALVESRPPFSPEVVCKQFAELFKSYGISTIYGDKYAGIWPVEQFAKFGINYQQDALPKSDLYQDLLPILNSCRIELLDDPRLIAQLCSLERRTSRGGRDSIDHPPGAHDDLSNVVAILTSITLNKYGSYDQSYGWVEGGPDEVRRSYGAERLSAWCIAHGIPH
jgi:hypothetical protein